MGEVMEGEGVDYMPNREAFGLEYFYVPKLCFYTGVSKTILRYIYLIHTRKDCNKTINSCHLCNSSEAKWHLCVPK